MLLEPAQSLTDLALSGVTFALAWQLRRAPSLNRHWPATFWTFGAAAFAGFVYHGFLIGTSAAESCWLAITILVVVAVSYLLAATVAEVLGPGRHAAFWLLRSAGLTAYLVFATLGHPGIQTILLCECATMVSVLALWGWAAYRHNPLAQPVLLAIVAAGAASALKAMSPALLEPVRLDPASATHLGQIAGMVLLYLALRGPARRLAPALPLGRPAGL